MEVVETNIRFNTLTEDTNIMNEKGAGYLVECKLFEAEYCCAYCGRTLRTRRLLIRHIASEHDPSIVLHKKQQVQKISRRCGRRRKAVVNLSPEADKGTNKREKHSGVPQKVTKCEWCGFESAYNSTLKRHAMRHTGTRPFACQFCQHTTTHKSQLERHLVAKHRDEVLATLCNSAVTNPASTIKTTDSVATTPSTISSAVNKPQSQSMSISTIPITESVLRLHRCTECDFSSPYSSSVVKHTMSKHSGEKRFACSECDFRTVHSSSLKLHLMVHTGVKPYACPHCEYRSTFSRNLTRHLSKHTGDRPYPCGICGFRSTTTSSHKRHVMTHTDLRPFACDLCSFSTSTKSSLKQHNLVVHLGSRPFHCDQCGYTTTRSYYLKLHKLRHIN